MQNNHHESVIYICVYTYKTTPRVIRRLEQGGKTEEAKGKAEGLLEISEMSTAEFKGYVYGSCVSGGQQYLDVRLSTHALQCA